MPGARRSRRRSRCRAVRTDRRWWRRPPRVDKVRPAHAYVAGRETGCSRSRARVSGMPPGQAKTSPKTIAGRENSIGTKPVEKLGSKPNRITDRTTTPIGSHSESFSVRIMRIELTTVSQAAPLRDRFVDLKAGLRFLITPMEPSVCSLSPPTVPTDLTPRSRRFRNFSEGASRTVSNKTRSGIDNSFTLAAR